MNPPEIAFLAVGLVVGGTFGAAFLVAARAWPPLRPVVRVTITPNAIQPRGARDGTAGMGYRITEPAPGSPDDDASRDAPAAAVDASAAAAAPEPWLRTRVPSHPVMLPASSVAIRVEPAPSRPVAGPSAPAPGPAASAFTPPVGGSTPATTDTSAARASAAPVSGPSPVLAAGSVAVAERAARPEAAPMLDRVDLAPRASAQAVSARASRPTAGPTLSDPVVGIPVHDDAASIRPEAASRAPRHAAGTAAAAGGAGTSADAGTPRPDPCADPRAAAVDRCAEAEGARETARAAADALRDARRAHATLEAQVEDAGAIADPRRLDAEKERLHAEFKARHDGAAGPDEAETAAREWLSAVSELNDAAREAVHRVQAGTAQLRVLAGELAKLDLEADAARIGAEAAEDACRVAREALARCEEQELAARATPAPVEPGPDEARWPGGPEPAFDREAAGPAASSAMPVIVRVLRGDATARERLVAALAGDDPAQIAAWHVRIARFVDAVTARAIEAGALDLPDDNPFWHLFGGDERRDIVAALSALGFRYDGLDGFADGRVPTARDLSLAVGYAGLDPMRIRTWPREAELAELYHGAVVLADGWLADQADDLALGRVVEALGARGAGLDDLWSAWGRVRPAMLADA